MAGVKITANEIMQPITSQVIATTNPQVGATTNTLDGFIQILSRIERIINSPTIQPIFQQAIKKWENQNNLGGNQMQTKNYNNPQVWEQPKTQQPTTKQEEIKEQKPIFTEEQLIKYFPTTNNVIEFIEKLLEILPEEITTHEVADFVNSYIGQLPNQPIKIIKPLFKAGKPLMVQQLAPIYARTTATTGVKGAEKGGKPNAKINDKTSNGKN